MTTTEPIIFLFKKLININDTALIISELNSYTGEDKKYFQTLIQNLGDDLSKFKYAFDLVLKINKENPKMRFNEIYFKFLSTKSFQPHRNFYCFLNKLVLDDDKNLESLLYEEEIGEGEEIIEFYNEIISSIDKESALKLIKDFLIQRSLTFEEYYYQKYLSSADKLKNALENNYFDVNQLYYRYPWITDAVVSKVYISSSEHDIDLFIDNPLTHTIFKSKTWYKPNNLFYSFISNQNNTRVIKNDSAGISTLEFIDDKTKAVTFSFHILYKLLKNDFNFSYYIFDETMYNLEKKFFTVDYYGQCNEYYINLFLDDVKMFTQININFMLEFFNKAMSNIQSTYSVNFSILKHPIMKNIRTLRELARKISEITVFINLDFISESIFKKRLIRNYYNNQNVLFDLKLEEKLPEILYDIKNRDIVKEYIDNSIETEIFNIGEFVYKLTHKCMFTPSQKKRTNTPDIVLEYINEFDNHNYFYYQNKDKWLNIKDILSKKYDDDEYISDVIFPRINYIYNFESMKKNITQDELKTKYSQILQLLEYVVPIEELISNHKDLFLYFPDPEDDYNTAVVVNEPVKPKKNVTSKPLPKIEEPKPEDEPQNDEYSKDIADLFELELGEPKPEPVVKESKPEPVVEESKSEPVVEESKPEPIVEESRSEPKSDGMKKDLVCSKCRKPNQSTNVFVHSPEDIKLVKSMSICYDCLDKYTISDDWF